MSEKNTNSLRTGQEMDGGGGEGDGVALPSPPHLVIGEGGHDCRQPINQVMLANCTAYCTGTPPLVVLSVPGYTGFVFCTMTLSVHKNVLVLCIWCTIMHYNGMIELHLSTVC